LLRKERPDLVQTWLQQSDLLGGLAARLAGVPHIFWNVRHSTLHPVFTSRRTHLVSRTCAAMARFIPERIVCCSESSRSEQLNCGYPADKVLVIPNGVDTARFKPERGRYLELRNELGVSPDVVLFGAAGRLHSQKDYPNLIRAAGQIANGCPDSHFVFCGEGITVNNPEIRAMVEVTGYPDRFHLLGQRDDVPRFMAGLDVFLSCACFGEGFPNVISEAMACGVPCVVTDIGDSALIVGDTGRVVPIGQPAALAEAALELQRQGRSHLQKLGAAAQRRISDCFSLTRMVDAYRRLYSETVLGRLE
jgi:glycosyltransferase involved in cell wall biosynthesis